MQIIHSQTTVYLGFVGGISEDSQTIEISHNLARLLSLSDDMLV